MHVLVIGHRQGLIRALKKRNICYSLLLINPLKSPPPGVKIFLTESFPTTESKISHLSQTLLKEIKPTHIIAVVEAGVYTASLLRRKLACRLSNHSMVRKCSHKSDMKAFLSQHNIPMSPFLMAKDNPSTEDIINKLKYPIVVKDIKNSGGRGISFVHSQDELTPLLGKNKIYEAFIEGGEGSIESFVSHKKILFTNITNYFIKKFSNILPANFEESTIQSILQLNQKVIKQLGISWGMTHLEFYLTKQGLLFGEIALRPPGGYIMELIEKAYMFDPWEALLCTELDLEFTFPTSATRFAGCLIYHPGEGVVKDVQTPHLPSLEKHKLKVHVGDQVTKRAGVGEDTGHTTFTHDFIEQIQKDILTLRDNPPVKIE